MHMLALGIDVAFALVGQSGVRLERKGGATRIGFLSALTGLKRWL